MPARIQEVVEYIGGNKRNRAFVRWVEQRRQEALRAARDAAAEGGGVGPEDHAGDWSESSDDLADDRYDYQELLSRIAASANPLPGGVSAGRAGSSGDRFARPDEPQGPTEGRPEWPSHPVRA
eukprot:7245969-Alexandrium_andersonii.AAC.1